MFEDVDRVITIGKIGKQEGDNYEEEKGEDDEESSIRTFNDSSW